MDGHELEMQERIPVVGVESDTGNDGGQPSLLGCPLSEWDRRGLQNTERRQDEERKSKFAWEGRGMVVVVSCVRHRSISKFTALVVGQPASSWAR